MINNYKTSGILSILMILLAGCGTTEQKSDAIDIKAPS